MKHFSTLSEFRKYNAEKSLRAYHKIMADPVKASAYRIERRKYEKERYRKMKETLT